MKIDLHLHSPFSIPNGDSIKWTSSLDTIKSLHLEGVKVYAFTDHNTFELSLYQELKKIAGQNMIIFPGVEVDILKENGSIGQILVIFENQLSNEQFKKLEFVCKTELRKQGIRTIKLNNIFEEFPNIKIPHVGKSDNFKPDELNKIDHDAIEIVSETHSNYKKWLKTNNNKSIVAFSDTHIWNNYPQNGFLYTEIDFDGTFLDLKAKLHQNKKYVRRKA